MTSSRFAWPLAGLAFAECALLFAVLCVSALANGHFNGHAADMSSQVAPFAFVCLIVLMMMFSVGLYTWHIATSYVDLGLRILASFLIAYLIYAAMVYAVDDLAIAPATLGTALLVAIPATFGMRLGFLRVTDKAHLKSRILVVGTGAHAARLAELEQRGRACRFMIMAFLDVNECEPKVAHGRIRPMPNDFLAFARRHDVDEIVLALEDRRGRLPVEPLIEARLSGLRVTDYQTFSERAQGHVDLDALRPSWFLHSDGFRSGRLHRALKRGFDIAVSAALLGFTLPIFVATAVAIKLESRGPIFYKQERVGQGGRPFVLTKFRSMRVDAEKADSPQWAQKGDPRVTRVGAIIRKTRIDEIPQALNVLKGDMSFVGPRPERPYFVNMLAGQLPYYQERHSVKPGITGWAQLNYPYGASLGDAREKLQYDLFYIKYFSIVFDLAIVMQTIRVVMWSEGAR